MSQGSALKEKTFLFAVRIVKLHRHLIKKHSAYDLAKQILRAGTNPRAMVCETFNAESDKDFIHKLSVGQKETAETIYWLKLLEATDYLTKDEFKSLNDDAQEVIRLIRSSILTKKKKLG